jgi:hypothetical protein
MLEPSRNPQPAHARSIPKILRRAATALILSLALTAIALPLSATDASAKPRLPHFPYRIDCGIITCSMYISKSQTVQLADLLDSWAQRGQLIVGGAAGAACAAALEAGTGGAGTPAVAAAAVGCATAGAYPFAHVQDVTKNAVKHQACIQVQWNAGSLIAAVATHLPAPSAYREYSKSSNCKA